jgi:hypothetical protein
MFDVSTLILACIYWLLIALVINENNIICTEGSYKAYIVKALYYEQHLTIQKNVFLNTLNDYIKYCVSNVFFTFNSSIVY